MLISWENLQHVRNPIIGTQNLLTQLAIHFESALKSAPDEIPEFNPDYFHNFRLSRDFPIS